jgi:hypothetical protein
MFPVSVRRGLRSFLMLYFVSSPVQKKRHMASQEHARREFPRMKQVWDENYFKIMVSALKAFRVCKTGLSFLLTQFS